MQQTVVKFEGYLQTVGGGERAEITIESDGKFQFVMPPPSNEDPFKLFREAPCTYNIQQIDSAASFSAIDPQVGALYYTDSFLERIQKLRPIFDIK